MAFKCAGGPEVRCTWPSDVVLPSRKTLMSISDPNVYAPRWAAAMSMLPVPAKGSNTRCPFLTCTVKKA